MSCYEDALKEIVGHDVPEFSGENWAADLQRYLAAQGLRARFIQIDDRAIVSRRLPNGKVHAETMHPTLITIIEKT